MITEIYIDFYSWLLIIKLLGCFAVLLVPKADTLLPVGDRMTAQNRVRYSVLINNYCNIKSNTIWYILDKGRQRIAISVIITSDGIHSITYLK